MDINYNVLDNMLIGLVNTDDITIKCKEEINNFLKNHDFRSFSYECAKELSGIWKLSMQPAYIAQTGQYLPNVFAVEEQ